MSEHHEFECNKCKKRENAKWNGEHYLAPAKWTEISDAHFSFKLNLHLCERCFIDLKINKPKATP